MQQTDLKLLSEIYNRYLETGKRECSVSFLNLPFEEKQSACSSLKYLEECGFIQCTAKAMGFWQFKITVDGIKFAENGFKEPELSSVIQGNNSVYIKGSGNTVSDNYNQISVNVSQSGLPDEVKYLIETLLYEMKNPHLTPEKKSDKIKAFLSDITSGAISEVATSGLTMLLTSLFSQISL